jgi:glycosyltransferase involved in cell wall biosynthesis
MRILHAIHDFLPRHQAGSQIYAFELCRALTALPAGHHVTVLCADYDPSRRHGQVTWRVHEGLTVVEIVNNWVCGSFRETYRPPLVESRIARVLHAVQPDVVHVHNLLTLSMDLPALAAARGIPLVATLHDYSLVCPSGGQRIHLIDRNRCDVIDSGRCAECFRASAFHAQAAFARVTARGPVGLLHRAVSSTLRQVPGASRLAAGAVRRAPTFRIASEHMDERLAAARRVFEHVALFVAPSHSMAEEFERLGVDAGKIRVADYGCSPLAGACSEESRRRSSVLRIGYVGTIAWHKGVHVLLDAVRTLPVDRYDVKIFGDPEVFPDYTAGLRKRSAGLPVRFMGPFDRRHAADVYRQLDVLVVPSLWLENSPLVVHEALMAAVPVVGSRIGGIAELIRHGHTGLLFEPASAAALGAALLELVETPALIAELSQGTRTAAPKSIDEDAREWERTYSGVVQRGSTVRATRAEADTSALARPIT